jgi:hypothetical protein
MASLISLGTTLRTEASTTLQSLQIEPTWDKTWKGSSVKALVLVCNWLHAVGQNHFYVMMHLNRDFAIQRSSRRFYTVYKSEKSDPLQPSGRHDIPSGRLTAQSIIRSL